jgi:F-type H+-transporting ATPase subunit delta
MNIKDKQYVQAFYELTQEKKCFDICLENLLVIKKNILYLKKILYQPQLSLAEKNKFLLSLNINDYLINFILLLVKNNDFSKISNIFNQLKNLNNKNHNIVEVNLIVSHALDDAEKELIKHELESKNKKKLKINYNTDPDILGGIIIQIGDKLIDNSLKNKLKILKKELTA